MAFLGAIAGGIGDLINGAANRAHENDMMRKQQEMQSQALDAQTKMADADRAVESDKNRRDGDRDDTLANQSIEDSKARNDLGNKVEDNDEKQAQFQRDQQKQQIDRINQRQDRANARSDAVDERSDENNFNIRSSFLKGAGQAIVEATYKQFNVLIITDQENDEWDTPVKGEIASQLVDVQLSDGSMVNFEARIFGSGAYSRKGSLKADSIWCYPSESQGKVPPGGDASKVDKTKFYFEQPERTMGNKEILKAIKKQNKAIQKELEDMRAQREALANGGSEGEEEDEEPEEEPEEGEEEDDEPAPPPKKKGSKKSQQANGAGEVKGKKAKKARQPEPEPEYDDEEDQDQDEEQYPDDEEPEDDQEEEEDYDEPAPPPKKKGSKKSASAANGVKPKKATKKQQQQPPIYDEDPEDGEQDDYEEPEPVPTPKKKKSAAGGTKKAKKPKQMPTPEPEYDDEENYDEEQEEEPEPAPKPKKKKKAAAGASVNGTGKVKAKKGGLAPPEAPPAKKKASSRASSRVR